MSLPLSASQIAGGDVEDIRQDLTEVYSLTRTNDGGYRVGDIPLVVLTRRLPTGPSPLPPDKLQYIRRLQDDLETASCRLAQSMGEALTHKRNNHA